MIGKPYQYPLIVGAVPATGVAQTVIRTVTLTIPANSRFVWTHTLNATVQNAAGIGATVRTQLYDSVGGPICNVPTLVDNIAGATFKTFSVAPRVLRPFPLPETYTFNRGSVMTATYTVVLTPNGGNPSFASVGIILCGYRITH